MPTILLVEDDTFLAKIYSMALSAHGFHVSVATNGEDGLRAIQKDLPHLVVMDIMLPRMDGFEMLERIKSESQIASIPVFVLSNLGQREDVERCMELGAAQYFIKAHVLPADVIREAKKLLASDE